MIGLSISPQSMSISNHISYIRHCKEMLEGYSTEEIEGLQKYIFGKDDGAIKNPSVGIFYDERIREDDAFVYSACSEIIKERKGIDYLLKLNGKRKPKSIKEKIIYFAKGTFPDIAA